ncbi:MAG: ankyrin repeat domain-containing protein [Ottowia sp.]|nr:ankyrin repeat domain-containing protein [Ottowia sp.]
MNNTLHTSRRAFSARTAFAAAVFVLACGGCALDQPLAGLGNILGAPAEAKTAQDSKLEAVKSKVAAGADAKELRKELSSVLSYWGKDYAQGERMKIVQLLLENGGVGVNQQEEEIDGSIPLSEALKSLWACSEGYVEEGGEAVAKEMEEIAVFLVSKGANPNATVMEPTSGNAPVVRTALGVASSAGSVSLVSALVEKGAKVNAVDEQGETPLHVAASEGKANAAKVLLDKGAKIEAKDRDSGWTPLMTAVSTPVATATEGASVSAYTDTVQLLVDKGANVNARSKKGETVLTLAQDAQNSLKGIWQGLAPAQRSNEVGQEYLVKINEYDKIINILKSAGAKASAGGKKASAKKRK